jgi:hypothetical protein
MMPPPPPGAAPLPRHGWKRTVCPAGGAHAWRPSDSADVEAPVAACAFGAVSLLLFWPALLLLPAVYLGSRALAVRTGDRVCDKCGMCVTNKVRAESLGFDDAGLAQAARVCAHNSCGAAVRR